MKVAEMEVRSMKHPQKDQTKPGSRAQRGRAPQEIIDETCGEYRDGASWKAKGGDKRDNPYGPGRQWVKWQAGFLGKRAS